MPERHHSRDKRRHTASNTDASTDASTASDAAAAGVEHPTAPGLGTDAGVHGCGAGCGHHHHPAPSPAPTGLRPAIERASLPLLTQIAKLPAWLPFLAVLVLILGGAWLGGWIGGIAVGIAILAVTWLLFLSWPRLRGVERLMRISVLFLVIAVAATQFIGS